VHVSGAHTVVTGYFWQPPAPSHRPLVPHDGAPMSLHMPRGSVLPMTMGVHFPRDAASEQLRHAPAQGMSQQTPSTQLPLWQSAFAPQAFPSLILPHFLLTHWCPGSHCASVVHSIVQAPSAHRKGAQLATPGGWHVPAPSHTPGRLRRSGPAHEGAMHCVSAAYCWHPPNPSHFPVVPQLAAPRSLQTARGSGSPESTGQHVPMRSGSAHDRQPPSQATLQHTPSAQKPDAHSPPPPHFAPLGFLPQLAWTHWRPPTHSALWAHLSKQAPVAALQP
jgi:hypothetical protein